MHGEMYTDAEAASYSCTAALIRSITVLARKLSVCESMGERKSDGK
jgi:hypothetical protein